MKSLYLVSAGFSAEPGQAAAQMARAYANLIQNQGNNIGSRGTVNSTNSGNAEVGAFTAAHFQLNEVNNFSPISLKDDYQQLTDAALSHRIVLHSFNIGRDPNSGSQRTSLTSLTGQNVKTERIYFTYARELNNGLARLAEVTGGTHLKSSDLEKDLNRAISQNDYYYVLAYQRPEVSGKKFRKIKLKCKRKGITLSYRHGYYPQP